MLRNLQKHATAITFVLIALWYLTSVNKGPDVNRYNKDDGSHFVVLGYNLANYSQYSTDTYVTSSNKMSQHGTWPPLYPAILATVINFFGFKLNALKYVNVCAGLCNLVITFYILRNLTGSLEEENHRIRKWVPHLVCLFTALSPAYIVYSQGTMMEVGFMLLTNACLLLLLKQGGTLRSGATGMMASLAFLYRPYAVFLLPSLLITSTQLSFADRIPKVKNLLACAIPLLLTVATWTIYSKSVANSPRVDYVTQRFGATSTLLERAKDENLVPKFISDLRYFHLPAVAELLAPFAYDDVYNDANHLIPTAVVSLTLLFLFLLGSWIATTKSTKIGCCNQLTVLSWILCGVTLQVIRPSALSQEPRYWLTYFPFILFYALIASASLLQKIFSQRSVTTAFPFAIFSLCAANFVCGVFYDRNPRFRSQYHKDVALALGNISTKLSPNALVISNCPHITFAGTGKSSLAVNQVSRFGLKNLMNKHEIFILRGDESSDDSVVLGDPKAISAEPFADFGSVTLERIVTYNEK
ncbi:hypothetical protein N9M41_05975 [Rhodopirellula sp.]|nr:hypothetical protein [Rhodopirellula sp.]